MPPSIAGIRHPASVIRDPMLCGWRKTDIYVDLAKCPCRVLGGGENQVGKAKYQRISVFSGVFSLRSVRSAAQLSSSAFLLPRYPYPPPPNQPPPSYAESIRVAFKYPTSPRGADWCSVLRPLPVRQRQVAITGDKLCLRLHSLLQLLVPLMPPLLLLLLLRHCRWRASWADTSSQPGHAPSKAPEIGTK